MASMSKMENPDPCCCPPVPNETLCSPATLTPPYTKRPEKYFNEIGAEMIGNQLIIRVEKDKGKHKRKKGKYDPPCDCEMVEIKRPSGGEAPKIVNAGNCNQILFRIHSRTHVGKDDVNYKPQEIAYKVEGCPTGRDRDHRRTIVISPPTGFGGTQDVRSQVVTDCDENVYLLRIKKNAETSEQAGRNIEVETRTPKPPIIKKP